MLQALRVDGSAGDLEVDLHIDVRRPRMSEAAAGRE